AVAAGIAIPGAFALPGVLLSAPELEQLRSFRLDYALRVNVVAAVGLIIFARRSTKMTSTSRQGRDM
ncbi:MAG: hypothetical protein M3144_01100, partial [Actinomycetota bacterium]|nr:hypothetical protein [Actinomycetota bacterium]